MEILRQAMTNRDEVQLVVARRAAPPSSHSMAALGEEPEEVGVVTIIKWRTITIERLSSSSGSSPERLSSSRRVLSREAVLFSEGPF